MLALEQTRHLKCGPRRAPRAPRHVFLRDRRQALAEVEGALKLDPASASVLFDAALVHEDLHNRDAALKAIEALLNTGQKKAEILASPVLEQLRKDPRFTRMAGPRP
jgi:hypothetical protein